MLSGALLLILRDPILSDSVLGRSSNGYLYRPDVADEIHSRL